jgi:hypothetical protein
MKVTKPTLIIPLKLNKKKKAKKFIIGILAPAIILLASLSSSVGNTAPLASSNATLSDPSFFFKDLKINLKVSVTKLLTNTITVERIIIDNGSFLTNKLENT